MATAQFEFLAGVTLEISGASEIVRHFTTEYGSAAVAGPRREADVRVEFDVPRGSEGATRIKGGHKTVGWVVDLGRPDRALVATIHLRGRPRWFTRSLVQGYFVEPLVSIAAARAEQVLVPAAAFATTAGPTLVLGRSGAGKSSLAARAAASGSAVWGDDQVFVDEHGSCRTMPRRMRFYSDIQHTAPAAWSRLPVSARLQLRARGVVRFLSRGYVAPSFAVASGRIGAAPVGEKDVPLARIVIVETLEGATRIASRETDASAAVDIAVTLLLAQRRHLEAGASPVWRDTLAATVEKERSLLARAFADKPVTLLSVPRVGRPATSIHETAHMLGIER